MKLYWSIISWSVLPPIMIQKNKDTTIQSSSMCETTKTSTTQNGTLNQLLLYDENSDSSVTYSNANKVKLEKIIKSDQLNNNVANGDFTEPVGFHCATIVTELSILISHLFIGIHCKITPCTFHHNSKIQSYLFTYWLFIAIGNKVLLVVCK